MAVNFLDFEQPIAELEAKIEELKHVPSGSAVNIQEEISRLQVKSEQLTQSIGVVLNTIEATMRTENLLKQSQQLTGELQSRQSELQQTNEELATKLSE